MVRETWIAEECSVSIWLEDAGGNVVGDAIFEDTFGQSFSAESQSDVIRRRASGRKAPLLYAVSNGYALAVTVMHYDTATDFSQFDDPSNRFRLYVVLENERYTGISPLTDDDPLVFSGCRPTVGLSGETGGGPNTIRLRFDAEERL